MARFMTFTKEMLEGEHIDVVREIARQIGVKSPTGRNKDVVIEDIIKIQQGVIKPIEKSKRGAPVKIKTDVSKFYEIEGESSYVNAKPVQNPVFRDVERDEDDCFIMEGCLEQQSPSYGFLRARLGENSPEDVYVSLQNIKKFNLRRGDKVKAIAKKQREGELAALQNVVTINDLDPRLFLTRKSFDELTPFYPDEKLNLEVEGMETDVALRCIDIFSPIGKGQRGLIVAPPKTGKTTLLKLIAGAIESNYPAVKLIVLLIDERPEEVTDIKRGVVSEVVYSTFDESPAHHVRTAEAVINRAKRMLEVGKDVVILMDSITRLTRAYNSVVESSGKTLSGGLDPQAMQGPKRIFGAARNVEGGGSLTILSTALIETGSRMDDVIYEEFKGTGNMEIHLSRSLSEKRIFPAIDLNKSGTRKEELLLSKEEMDLSYKLRRILSEEEDATDKLIDMMKKTKNNKDLAKKVDVYFKSYKK